VAAFGNDTMQISYDYTVCIWIWDFIVLAATNDSNRCKNSATRGIILNFLNSYLQETLFLIPFECSVLVFLTELNNLYTTKDYTAVIAQSVQCWVMGWMIGVLGFDSERGLGIFLFTTASRTALGPTQPPIQWVRGALSLGVKQPGREDDHSPPSSAEVTMSWAIPPLPNTPTRRGAQLQHRDNFTLTK
jgi:hypothetical protein